MDFSNPTAPSIASRFPELKSRASCRGFAVYKNRTTVFESHIELCVIWICSTMPDVVEIIDQPPAVTYVDSAGIPRKHTFDFLVIMADGRRLFLMVKPAAKATKARALARMIAGQLAAGTANSIHVVTDADFSRTDRHNAQLLFECMRFPISAHDSAIDSITVNMAGAVKVNELVSASGLGGLGFRAVMRALARGILAPAEPGARITADSYVVRNKAPQCSVAA